MEIEDPTPWEHQWPRHSWGLDEMREEFRRRLYAGEDKTNVDEKTPPPGSDEALDLGCHCPVLDNAHGKGYLCQPGVYVVNLECPMHGGPMPPKGEATHA